MFNANFVDIFETETIIAHKKLIRIVLETKLLNTSITVNAQTEY